MVGCDSTAAFLYTDKIDTYTVDMVTARALDANVFRRYDTVKIPGRDSLVFSGSEMIYVKEQMNLLKKHVWQEKLLPHAKRLTDEAADSLFARLKKTPEPLETKLCTSVHRFSKPFFLRDNTVCFFYYSERNVAYASGECWIYLKVNGEWRRYTPLYRWTGDR